MRARLNKSAKSYVGAALAVAGVFYGACSSDDVTTSPVDAGGAESDSSMPDSTLPMTDASPAADAAVHARNWTAHPAVVQVDGVSEIWALSDVHGDYAALVKLLAGANVIAKVPDGPSAVQWTAGTATLVVVGDLIDKGPDAPDVVRVFVALGVSAAASGGRVIVTMGNHEAEFLADPANDKASKTGTDEGIDPELVAIGVSPDAAAAGEGDIGAFLRDLPIACRVDDWFFVHAGKTDGSAIAELGARIENEVDDAGFGANVLAADASILEARLESSPPQWWDATGDAGALLDTWASALGARHIVMGHQPGAVGITSGPDRKADDMFAAFGGRIFLVDTGMSSGVDATGGALLHVKNAGDAGVSWEEVLPNGSKKSL